MIHNKYLQNVRKSTIPVRCFLLIKIIIIFPERCISFHPLLPMLTGDFYLLELESELVRLRFGLLGTSPLVKRLA